MKIFLNPVIALNFFRIGLASFQKNLEKYDFYPQIFSVSFNFLKISLNFFQTFSNFHTTIFVETLEKLWRKLGETFSHKVVSLQVLVIDWKIIAKLEIFIFSEKSSDKFSGHEFYHGITFI